MDTAILKKNACYDMSVDIFGPNGDDVEKAIEPGVDGIIVSNHGEGRLMLPRSFNQVNRKKCRVSLFQNELKHL